VLPGCPSPLHLSRDAEGLLCFPHGPGDAEGLLCFPHGPVGSAARWCVGGCGSWQVVEERRLALAARLGEVEESQEELRTAHAMAGELAETAAQAQAAGESLDAQRALQERVSDLEERLAMLSDLHPPGAERSREGKGPGTPGSGAAADARERSGGWREWRTPQQNAELKRVVSEQKSEMDAIRGARAGPRRWGWAGGAFGRLGPRKAGGIMGEGPPWAVGPRR